MVKRSLTDKLSKSAFGLRHSSDFKIANLISKKESKIPYKVGDMVKVRKFNHGVYIESPFIGQDHVIRIGNVVYGKICHVDEKKGEVIVEPFHPNGIKSITANYWSKDIRRLGGFIDSYVPGLHPLVEKYWPVFSFQKRDNFKLDDPNSPLFIRSRVIRGKEAQYV